MDAVALFLTGVLFVSVGGTYLLLHKFREWWDGR